MEREIGYGSLIKALDTSIEVWTYLYKHPEILEKTDLPSELFNKIVNLCTLFMINVHNDSYDCPGCPLNFEKYENSMCNINYHNWVYAEDKKDRKKAAKGIVNILKKVKKDI
jgi:hypothetical protein